MIIRLGIISKIKGGKGTAVKYLSNHYAAESVRYSTPLREMLACLGIQPTRDNLQDVSTYVRQRYGESVIGQEIVQRLNALKGGCQIVEGIRRPADIAALVEDPLFRSIYVSATPETRYERQQKFPENPGDAEMTWEQFLARDSAEAEKDIEAIGGAADFHIHNEGISLEEYHRQIEAILDTIRKT